MSNELWIYDAIGEGLFESGVTAESVRDDLAKLDKTKTLDVRINSPGGSLFEGVAIRSQIANWPAGHRFFVDGLAASAASYIATAGGPVSMAEGSMLMIHKPRTLGFGTDEDLIKAGNDLTKIGENMIGAYAKRSNKTDDEIRKVMEVDTWLTPSDAITFGLADEENDTKAVACAVPAIFKFKPPAASIATVAAPVQRTVNKFAMMQRDLDLSRAIATR